MERRGHGLARIDVAMEDDTVDRGGDRGLVEVDLGEAELGFGDGDVGLGTFEGRDRPLVGGLGEVEVGRWCDAAGDELAFALEVAGLLGERRFGLDHLGARRLEPGAAARDPGLEAGGVEPGEDPALFDPAVEVDEDLADDPGKLARDLDEPARLDGAGGGHEHGERARARRCRDPADAAVGRAGEPPGGGRGEAEGDEQREQPLQAATPGETSERTLAQDGFDFVFEALDRGDRHRAPRPERPDRRARAAGLRSLNDF